MSDCYFCKRDGFVPVSTLPVFYKDDGSFIRLKHVMFCPVHGVIRQ